MDIISEIGDICLFGEDKLLIGDNKGCIKMVDLEYIRNDEELFKIEYHDDNPVKFISIKIIEHPLYGKCLISQDEIHSIKLFKINL